MITSKLNSKTCGNIQMSKTNVSDIMQDIRRLVSDRDLSYVRSNAERLVSGEFVQASVPSVKYGSASYVTTSNTLEVVLGTAGIVLAACIIGFLGNRLHHLIKNNQR